MKSLKVMIVSLRRNLAGTYWSGFDETDDDHDPRRTGQKPCESAPHHATRRLQKLLKKASSGKRYHLRVESASLLDDYVPRLYEDVCGRCSSF
ncbi:hypothetical protein Bealeia2_02091 (plasmid) [Candidatus Bealeia paramacronuclearis]|nr:hypothetical protein [Candidatus Bealeia paramacronuclearis]